MKIVCDSCGTKYSIADDKVRGKVFKIRCKKCSHIIVVRGGESGGPEAAAAPAADGGWHLVVDGEQVGPVSDADVRTKIERGEVKGDTYTWKEGFADWVKLSAVPEFAALVTEDVGGGAAGGDLFTAGAVAAAGTNGADRARRPSGAGQSLFGGGGAASDVFAAPAATARSGGGDLFGSAAAPASQGSAWPSSGAAAAGHDGGRVESLTGQRHENSVLFSLSNLQSLAMPSAKPAAASPAAGAPVPEGSGLIDIRAMAASTLGTAGKESNIFGGVGGGGGGSTAVEDLPAFGSFSPAAPVLLPLPSSSGPPKWIYPLILVMIALVGGIIFMAVKVLGTKPPVLVEQVQQIPAPEQPKAAAVPAAEPAAKKPSTIAEENLPPREGAATDAKAGEKAEKGEHEHEHHHGSGKGHESGKKGDDKKNVVAAAAAAPPIEGKKPVKGSLDDLLNDATPSRGGRHGSDDDSKPAAAAGPLAKSAVVAGMNSVKPKIASCYNDFKVGGMAMVNIVIGKSGKVSSATVTGKFAGTPTGGCVEKAVKSATFPPSDGLTTMYPFVLR
jgi:predicted Zn finger-like uncharacterized protein